MFDPQYPNLSSLPSGASALPIYLLIIHYPRPAYLVESLSATPQESSLYFGTFPPRLWCLDLSSSIPGSLVVKRSLSWFLIILVVRNLVQLVDLLVAVV